MFSKFLMVVAIICISAASQAQYKLSGIVRDPAGEILPGATLRLEGTTQAQAADARGRFAFRNLPAGNYVLLISYVGFESKTEQVNLTADVDVDIRLSDRAFVTDEVIVRATRADAKTPTAFSSLDKKEIRKQNFGQDLPILLNWQPSVVTTSDAGAGVGYTSMWIRGSDQTRINVTINGVPLNDSESQGVFWVDIPDIASSTENIQIQRGVGTSTNGAGAFGASVNLQTNTVREEAYADIINAVGSFNTRRHTAAFGTGLIGSGWTIDGRFSRIESDGFIDRASSDLRAYYMAAGYYGKKTMLKAILFGGHEVTYQAWYGVPESRLNNDTEAMQRTAEAEGWSQRQLDNLLNSNSRTFNVYTYPNQVDDYAQDHYQLHFSHRLTDNLTANTSLHYTYGRGFYEQFRERDRLSRYGLDNVVIGTETISRMDLVRRRWLDNDFYGFTYAFNYEKEKLSSTLGGAWNRYEGDHFGEIIWAQYALNFDKDHRYYYNLGDKRDFNVYWKNAYQLSDKLSAFVDVQFRSIAYTVEGIDNDRVNIDVDVNYDFFNPKLGLNYVMDEQHSIFASYSIANREPVRRDFIDAPGGRTPLHETLRDLEIGFRRNTKNYNFNMNYYFMDYVNQLVLTGALNDVGAAIRTNAERSYRTGVELDFQYQLNQCWTWAANLSLSRNKIREFTEVLYDYGVNFDEFNVIENQYQNTDISFSPSVISGSILSYKPVKNLELSLLSKYVGQQFLDNTSNVQRSLNAYFVNDLRMIYSIQPKFIKNIDFSLLVNNLMNAAYESNGYTYGYFGGGITYRENFYYPQAGTNFMFSVGLSF